MSYEALPGKIILSDTTTAPATLYDSSFVSKGSIGAPTMISKKINLVPLDTAPATPHDGDMFFDVGTHKLKVYENNAWKTVTTS